MMKKWLQESKEKVEFFGCGVVYSLSFRPCTVILEITSERDVDDGFLASENLGVSSIKIMEGDALILKNIQ